MKNSIVSVKTTRAAAIAMLLLSLALSVLPILETYGQEIRREETLISQIDAARVEAPEDVWNPFVPGGMRGQGYHQLIMEPLFIVDLHTGEYVPWLAERYEYNPDFTEFTVYLRRGVKWNDGVTFTADDVIFTYDLIFENPETMQYGGVTPWVESVEKVDDYTIRIHLTKSNPRFHYAQEAIPVARMWGGMPLVPKHIWEKEDPLMFRNYPNPVGTGPYTLVSVSETEFVYERRDDWWGTEIFGVRPAPKWVIYRAVALEETVAMMLTRHEIDSIARMSTGLMADVKAANPYVVTFLEDKPYQWFDPCPTHLHPNYLRYPLSITEVRRAISYMIDRDYLVSVGLEYGSRPTKYPVPEYGGMVPFFEAIEDLIDKYEPIAYNPDKARQLLENVGFTMGADGVWIMPNGERFAITLTVHEFEEDEMAMTPLIVQQLKEGGIDVVWKGLTHAAVDDVFTAGDFDIVLSYTCPGDSDPFFMMDFWHSRFWKPEGEYAGANFARYKNPEYDAILDEWAKIPPTDLEKTTQLWREAANIYYRDVISIPITHEVMMSAAESYYWVGWPTERDAWMQPCDWWQSFVAVITGYPSPHAGGEWVKGLRPREVDYLTVYFTKESRRFRGIDHVWYGPLVSGDAARIPVDDAEFWIEKGYASLTPPTAIPVAELKAIADAVSGVKTSVDELKTSVETVRSDVAGLAGIPGLVNILAAGIVIEAIAIIILGVALLRRRPG